MTSEGGRSSLEVGERLRWLGPLAAVAAFSLVSLPPADTYWHLAAGREIVSRAGLLGHDPFSFTAGDHPWINHEWLAEILLYGVYQAGGWGALYAFRTLVVMVSFALLPMLTARSGVPVGWLCLAGLYLGQAGKFLDVRAYLFSYLFLALTFFAVSRYRASSDRRHLVLPVLLGAVWANCHGGYILGPIALGLAAVGACFEERCLGPRGRTLLAASVAAMLLALLNPYGVHIWLFPFSLLERSAYSIGLNEWSRPDLLGEQAGYLGLILLAAGLTFLGRRERPWVEIAWSAFFLAAGVAAWRHEILAGLAVCFLSARCLPPARWPAALTGATCVAALAWLGLSLAPGPERWALRRQLFPVYALEFLQANPGLPHRIANPYEWGGFLDWHLGAEGRTMIDGRAHTVFPEQVYKDALHLQFGPAWARRLEGLGLAGAQDRVPWEELPARYQVDLLLASRIQGDLDRRLEGSKEWRLIYLDHLSALYLRDRPEYRDLQFVYPRTPPRLLQEAIDAFRQRRWPESERTLRAALEVDPGLPLARYYLAIFEWERGHREEALRLLDRELELNPANEPARGLRARWTGQPGNP